MSVVILLLVVAAVVLTALAAFGVSAPRLDLGWLGVALVFLALLLQNVVH